MVALFYLVLSCCNLQKLSYCLWWRQTDIITGAWKVLTRDILPNLTTEAKMFVLQAITIQMGCCSQDQLTDYWTKIDQFYTPFYSNMMKWNRYLHIPRFMHFTDNRNGADKTEENYDYGKYEMYLKIQTGHFQNITPLQKIWQLVKLQFCSKERWVSDNIFPSSKNILVSNYRIYVTWLDTPMTCNSTWGRTGSAWHNSWQ